MAIESKTEQPGKLREVISVHGKHTVYADVDVASGGEGSAPSPHDYYDTALAACKVATAVWYAKKHGMALERAEARVERDDSKERQGTYVLKVTMAYEGALSAEQREKLQAAVMKCPIHRLMTAVTTEIETAPL
jgi:putative redox protein